MMSLFSNMDPMMIWLIIGALLILLELIAPGVYLFWLGIAALVTGFLLKVVDLSLTMQILSFAAYLSALKPIRIKMPILKLNISIKFVAVSMLGINIPLQNLS